MYTPRKSTHLHIIDYARIIIHQKQMVARYFAFTLIFVLLSTAWLVFSLSLVFGSQIVALEHKQVRGASLYVITADLNNPRIRVDIGLPTKGIAHSESFKSMVRRRTPVAAVTGTYFDTRSLIPVGTIIVSGKMAHDGAVGTAVCFLKSGKITCEPYSVKFMDKKRGEKCDWTGVECGFRTGPRLLANGLYALNPRREGFRDPGLFGSRTRMAMGTTKHNKLLLVTVRTPVTFGRLAGIMRKLGAVDSVCLDGGTSSAMYYRGRLVQSPGRNLTNILEVHEDVVVASAPGLPQNATQDAVNGITVSSFFRETLLDNLVPATKRPAMNATVHDRPQTDSFSSNRTYQQLAVLNDMGLLSRSKCFHSFIPINRAKLAGLKGFDYSKNFINVAPNVQVMHHLIS